MQTTKNLCASASSFLETGDISTPRCSYGNVGQFLKGVMLSIDMELVNFYGDAISLNSPLG